MDFKASVLFLYNGVKYKMKQRTLLKRLEYDVDFISLMLTPAGRKEITNAVDKAIFKRASKEGCIFTHDTPAQSLYEVFVDRIYDVPRFLPGRGDIVVDVGANYGDTAVWWGKVFGARVVAFEPLADVYGVLCRNIALNGIVASCHNIALGDGTAVSSTRSGDMLMFSADGGSLVPTATLDSIDLDRVDLLKIDVEGFEVHVLRGAVDTIRKHKPRIILETHSSVLRTEAVDLLSGLGYRIAEEGRTLRPENSWMR